MSDATRIYEFWCGAQGRGKTYALMRRAKTISQAEYISGVIWCDHTGEAEFETDWPVARNMGQHVDLCDLEIPPIIVWDCWSDDSDLDAERAVQEAMAQGGMCVIIDEMYKVSPGNKPLSKTMERVCLAGRHLPSLDGELCPLHIVIATQHPRSIHHLWHGQARSVLVTHLQGKRSEVWLREEFGDEALSDMESLETYHWLTLREDIDPEETELSIHRSGRFSEKKS